MKLPFALTARPTQQMPLSAHLRKPHLGRRLGLLAALPLLAGTLCAQISNLPPTPPTSLPAANNLPAPLAATPAGDSSKPQRARVTFANGQLDVRADNSSLNQILHQISSLTGMKITGGVTDERVFGNYGPASPSDILATLLDGTGTNVLVREDRQTQAPVELILTPRGGGPTPPSPNAQAYDDEPAPPPSPRSLGRGFAPTRLQPPTHLMPQPAAQQLQQQTPQVGPIDGVPPQVPQPLNNPLGDPANSTPTASQVPVTNSVPTDAIPQPSTAQEPRQGIVDSPNPPPANSTTATSPNGVRTPQEIYQQLLKLQQQQTQDKSNANSPSAPPSTTTVTPQ